MKNCSCYHSSGGLLLLSILLAGQHILSSSCVEEFDPFRYPQCGEGSPSSWRVVQTLLNKSRLYYIDMNEHKETVVLFFSVSFVFAMSCAATNGSRPKSSNHECPIAHLTRSPTPPVKPTIRQTRFSGKISGKISIGFRAGFRAIC